MSSGDRRVPAWHRLGLADGGELALIRSGPAGRSTWRLERRNRAGELVRTIPLGVRPATSALTWLDLEALAIGPEGLTEKRKPASV